MTSVVFMNPHLGNKLHTGFIYIHQNLDKETHLEMLAHLSCALNLSDQEQEKYTIITDGDAPLIKAWMLTFSNLKQLLCSIHFCKNIEDKMKYQLHKRPSPEQMADVMRLFQGTTTLRGIIDMTKQKLLDTEEKILNAM